MNNIQKNFKAKSALRHRADGGRVSGPGGPTDDKVGPVMLSDEEYVLPADTVEAVGVKNLDALRDATHKYEKPDWDMDADDALPLNRLRDGGRPKQPVQQTEEPRQYVPLPLPAEPHEPDTNPDHKFMYENPLGDTVDDARDALRKHIPGLRDGGSRRQYSAGVAPAFDREKYVAMGKAMQQDRGPRRQYSAGTEPNFELPQAEPRGLRRQYGSMQHMANGGLVRPKPSGSSFDFNATSPSPLRTSPPNVPPVGGNPVATVPGGNTLPAVRNPNLPANQGGGYGGRTIKDVTGEVIDNKPRIGGPTAPVTAAAEASAKSPWYKGAGGRILGGLAAAGLAGKNMYDVSQDPESDWKDVLNQGGHELAGIAGGAGGATAGGALGTAVFPGAGTVAGGVAGGGGGYYAGQELANKVDSLLGGDGLSPLAAIEKRKEAAANPPVGVMAPKDPNALSDFAGRITKDAVSRPGGSALRSEGGPMFAPTPNGLAPNTERTTPIAPTKGYQTEQLTKLGVSPEAQNGPSLPQGAATLQSYGNDKFQNLGTYGGDANLYGRADDPSRPGRMNNFVGVGATATPQSALRGGVNTMPSNDYRVQRGRELLEQDKTKGPGSWRSANGRDPNKLYIGTADGELGSTEQRFGQLMREARQAYGRAGDRDLLTGTLSRIEGQRQKALTEQDAQSTLRRGQDTLASTAKDRLDLDRRGQDITAETERYKADATAASALRSAEIAALKDERTVRNENEKNLTKSIDDTVKALSEGDATKAAQLHNVLTTMPPKMQAQIENMSPANQRALLQAIASVHGTGTNMDAGRDTGAMLQNGAIAGTVAGAGSALSGKYANGKVLGTTGKYLDSALQFVPKVRNVVPKHGFETLGGFVGSASPVLATAGGAYFTPKNQPSDRIAPLQYNADGTPTVQSFNWTDALTNGTFDTLWDTNFRRTDGRLVNKAGLTPDQVDAYRMILEANQ